MEKSAHVETRMHDKPASAERRTKVNRSRRPSLAANRMPRVGRSSDSRAVSRRRAFSPNCDPSNWSLKRPVHSRVGQWPQTESFALSRLQRRGRPGFAPGSLFRRQPKPRLPTTNARRTPAMYRDENRLSIERDKKTGACGNAPVSGRRQSSCLEL